MIKMKYALLLLFATAAVSGCSLFNNRHDSEAAPETAVSKATVKESQSKSKRKNSMTLPLLAYSPPYGENYLKQLDNFSFMRSCGINTVKLILSNSYSRIGIPYSPYPPIWKGEGEYDFSVTDRQISDIVKYNPDVRFIAMIDLNSPPWLVKKMGKDSFDELGECYLDPQWLAAVSDYQQKLVEYLEKNHADRIVAYYVACGRTQEWFDRNMFSPSPLRVKNYPAWCRANGKKLLPLPQPQEYDRDGYDILPEHLSQYLEYGTHLTRDCAEYFFKRIRKMIRPEVKLFGVFGNIHDIGSLAHVQCEGILGQSLLDVYIGPSCNSDIPMGGASGFQSSQQMLKRLKVHYLHSCDRQLSTTSKEIGPGIFVPNKKIMVRQPDAKSDVACLKREVAISIVHGFSLWFFDIWGNAYSGAEVQDFLKKTGSLWNKYSRITSGSDAETLLVFSPESRLHFPPRRVDFIAHQLRRRLLPEGNIHFTTAALGDLTKIDLSKYKMIIFQYVDYLSEADRKMIKDKVCGDGRVIVWCNHPGIKSENGIDHDGMEKLCGVSAKAAVLTEKTFPDWHSIVIPNMESCTPQALRAAGEKAGIHFFTRDADLKIWSSKEFVSAHTRGGGRKTIKLKSKAARITEVFSGKLIAENTDVFADDFASPDTKLYHLEYSK
ncbi:MAG: hypothetical protein J6S24_07480 [Lentisphaeria bacterium]|nr:hypothetical protein [Lentisphaeria bacterium]